MTRARVRCWRDDEGWGVVDSAETPGGCWVHFSAVATAGHRSLSGTAEVELEWEAADQDGFPYRAVRTWPVGSEPAAPASGDLPAAYRSTLTLTVDEPGGDDGSDGGR